MVLLRACIISRQMLHTLNWQDVWVAMTRFVTIVSILLVLLESSTAFHLPRFQSVSSSSVRNLQRLKQVRRQVSTKQGSYTKTSPVLKTAVGLLTGGLNNLARQDAKPLPSNTVARRLSPAVLRQKIEKDYKAAYFLTGHISTDAYDENCLFTDPTLSFSGLDTWSRNINNLKIFFRDPRLELREIRLDTTSQTVNTQWRLTCEIALPWRPFIDVEGATVHRYDPSKGGRVVEHTEYWAVSGFQALLQLFKPGKGRPMDASSASSTAQFQAGVRLLASTVLPISLSLLSASSLPSSPASTLRSAFVARAASDERRQVADIPASGLIFKDSINVEAFQDPKVQGVTLYISDFRRPLTERLAKDFFSDPSQASVACVRTGPVTMKNIDLSKQGEEVFSEARSLLFKTIRVRRVYDKESKALIYISYSTRFSKSDDDNKSRFKSSLCAIPVEDVDAQGQRQ